MEIGLCTCDVEGDSAQQHFYLFILWFNHNCIGISATGYCKAYAVSDWFYDKEIFYSIFGA